MTITHLPHVLVRNADGTYEIPEGHVTTVQLVNLTGCTYRQIDYWTRTGLLHPAPRRPNAGSGTPQLFPTAQVHRAATVAWLLDAGLSLQTIRCCVDELLEVGQVRLARGLVVAIPEHL